MESIGNSMDSLPLGGEIDIECFNENGEAKISFADSGSGINEDNISKIFDPFFTTKEIGTGLGLSNCAKGY